MDAPNYVQGQYTVAQRDEIFTKAAKYPDAADGLQNQVPTIFPDGSIGWRQIPEGGDGTANANIAVIEQTNIASVDYNSGQWLIYNDQLYQVFKPISAGEELNQLNIKSITVGREALTRISKGENLFRNWFFKGGGSQQGGGQYPINQRGLTSYTAVGETIDGWFQTGGTTTVSANFIQHVSPANESSDFYQIVDLPYASDIYTDMSLTFSAVAASRFRYGTAVINSDLLTETVVVSYNSFQLILQLILPDKIKATIRVFAGETVTMSMAKLEFGQRQTLMSDLGTPPTWDAPPDYGEELAKCQRYLCKLNANIGIPGMALGGGGNAVYMYCNVPVPMAGTPRILDGVSGTALTHTADIAVSFAADLPAVNNSGTQLAFSTTADTSALSKWVPATLLLGDFFISAE